MRRCAKCTLDNDDDAKFCIGCGTPLPKPTQVTVSLGEEQTMGDEARPHSARPGLEKEKSERPSRVGVGDPLVSDHAANHSLGDDATIGFEDGIVPLPNAVGTATSKRSPIAGTPVSLSETPKPREFGVDADADFVPQASHKDHLGAAKPPAMDNTTASTPLPMNSAKLRETASGAFQQLATLFRAAIKSTAGIWSRRETLARGTGTRVGGVLNAAIETVKFYWLNRRLLWRTLVIYVPALEDSNLRTRELHLRSDHDFDGVEFRRDGWRVRLPKCCVVCGEATDNEWIKETRRVDQMERPLWSAVAGLVSGLAIATYLWWSFWPIPLFGFAGLWLGYLGRSHAEVDLQFRLCDRHAANAEFPGVRLASNVLIVEVGKRAVKSRFLDEQKDRVQQIGSDQFV